jgi:hypothetical protein
MTPRIVRYAPVGTTKEGGGNMSKQQIPPLHCGMTNKKGKCKGKNNCYAHEVSISQLYVD